MQVLQKKLIVVPAVLNAVLCLSLSVPKGLDLEVVTEDSFESEIASCGFSKNAFFLLQILLSGVRQHRFLQDVFF